MSYLFVTFSANYADEFDVEGCFVISEEQYKEYLRIIKIAFEKDDTFGEEIFFGTNEWLDFDNFGDFEDSFNAKQCSKEFHDEFMKLNGCTMVGFDLIGRLIERAHDMFHDADF